jgi:hypothetical protein
MRPDGSLIRLFPVPFRLIDGSQQFKKWQWIRARIERAPADRRPESHKLFVDTVSVLGDPLPTTKKWEKRRDAIAKFDVFDDFAQLEQSRVNHGTTLGLVRPATVRSLEITPVANPDWSDEEKAKLVQSQRQGGLFDDADAKVLTTLKKLPFDFHYRYVCTVAGSSHEYRHKIADWEAGALFWTCFYDYGRQWEQKFRAKLEAELPASDLMFLMGTIHRFPDQWLIVSLIYPPKLPTEPLTQPSLFDWKDGPR